MREILESICSHIDFNITAIQYGYVNLDGKYQAIYDNGKGPITQSHWTNHIKKYSDDELKVILEQLSNSLDKRIKEEQARNQMLKNQLELEKMNIDSLE